MGTHVLKEQRLDVRDEIVEIIDALEQYIAAEVRLSGLGVETTDEIAEQVGDAVVERLKQIDITPEEGSYILLKLLDLLGKYN